MKERILKLCKRLNKFSQADIETISGLRPYELMPILYELQTENIIDEVNGIYYFQKTAKEQNRQFPRFFQLHSKQDIEYIIKSFCADIEVQKLIMLFNLSEKVSNKFYQYLRISIYEKQFSELLKHFEIEPKIGQERIYLTAKVYLYLYNDKLYVSKELLKSKNIKKHTNEERLEIKNIYLRSFRKVLSKSYTYKFHIHLAEEIWKYGKAFNTRYNDLNNILFT